jgi:hypothetical protein
LDLCKPIVLFWCGFNRISDIQPVAEPADAYQVARLCRIISELTPKSDDMAVHRAFGDECLSAPSILNQLIAAQHPAPVVHENFQELEFKRRKYDGFAAPPEFGARKIDFHIAESKNVLIFSFKPAQNRPYARAEFPRAERFGYIIVGPQVEPENFFRFVGFGGQYNNRRAYSSQPDVPADVKAIPPGKHDIQNDQIPSGFAPATARGLTIPHHFDLVTVGYKIVLKEHGDVTIVFHQQYSSHNSPPDR